MKPTLLRLRGILSTNLHFFVVSTIVTSAIYTLLILAVENLKMGMGETGWLKTFQFYAVIAFFVTPIFVYLYLSLAKSAAGITEVHIDVRVIKRNLFVSLGCLWTSIGFLIATFLLTGVAYIDIFSIVIGLISWIAINNILINYVTRQ